MNSILRQTNPNWEYWLACNPSTSNIIETLKKETTDSRIKLLYYLQGFNEQVARVNAADNVFYARIDSDDMYSPDVAEMLLTAPIKEGFGYFQFNAGYAYCSYNKKLYPWHQNSSPFYVTITSHGGGWPGMPGHAKIISRPHIVMPAGKFCVLIHGRNTSTNLTAGPIKKEIRGDHEKKGILNEFGIA
jgi:glycosyltransferase involved in cell wall biosynthesis